MAEILDHKRPHPYSTQSWATLPEREIKVGFDELVNSALGSLYLQVERAECDFGNPYCPNPDLKRLLVVILAYRTGAIAAKLHTDLPEKPGMESAHCIGSIVFGEYELEDNGNLILPRRADPLEAGKKWLSRLRKRHQQSEEVTLYHSTGNALQDWEQTNLFSMLLGLLPSRKGRPRLDRQNWR